ncbi:hypothetical protein L7F22_045678 [Adiantum nelumboides]|nr:hypothetical protein [Adiantum nelumboides]
MKDLGLLHHYLGIQFKQCDGGIALCQKSYIETLLCKFGLEDCKPIATPMETGLKLSLHDAGDLADVTLYQTTVGCLIYVCNTRSDIQFAVSQVSRFMHSPGSKHWQAVKRIFCYLSGTLHLGLLYPRGGSLPPDLHAFSDSNWAGCFNTRVSTSGFCFMLGSSCISWLSKKQPTVATSSWEAEYKAVFTATVECVWIRRLMADLGVGQDTANTIYTDNQSALAVARNPIFHARTKHIEVHYHYIRERLSAGEISLAYVPTQDNLADLFTKALSRVRSLKLSAVHKWCLFHAWKLMHIMVEQEDTANTIYIDSHNALAVARNPVFHARTKHIEVHYHYVRERLSAREIVLAYVPTQDNLADIFTKALSREKLEAFRKALGLLPFVD